jgi:lipopolysaccharide/colanic/teichoic acid biosynthesis glycosyltransferase
MASATTQATLDSSESPAVVPPGAMPTFSWARDEHGHEDVAMPPSKACRPQRRTWPRRRGHATPSRHPVTSSPAYSRFQQLLTAGQPFVTPEGNRSPAYFVAKRALDVVGALVLLAVLSPIMLTVYVVLWFGTRGRPVFRQVRLGWCGRPFVIYKFRTMRADAEERQHEVVNEQSGPIFKNRRDPRVTWFGRLLRRTSLDETPQLVNVLAGQMSLVGPRPPLAREVAKYEPWQRRRLAVKPGLTCLWQVSGRSEVGFEDWVRMDLQYARRQGLAADLGLLARTPWTVLTCRGAY